MSRIGLLSNTSGAATFTIAAPATNTNRTLTLPDAAGTFNISGLANEVPAGSNASPSIYPTGDNNTGIFFPAADTIAFAEGGTERMRIDSSGNVGIGLTPSTSDPLTGVVAGALQVNGNIELRYFGTNSDPAGARYFNIVNTDTTLVADQPMGGIQWVGLDDTNPNSNMASITSYCASNAGTTGDLRFKIAGTERVRITSDGRFYVNQTAGNGNTLQRMGVTYDGATEWAFAIKTTAASGAAISFQNSSGTQVGVINQSNTGTSYVTSSDYRLKENFQPMQDALAKIAQLNPVTYTWKSDGSDGQGFIAHELQAVVPDCVVGEKDAVDAEGNPQYQGIDTSFLVATLVKAIQEQQATITALEARISALENTQ